uniref:cell division protein n=1 Tax=Parallela transversalis TaxID=163324 RepID=UPI0010C3E757|nr:cell division protein [Parallela transversalis]AYQ22895.1 cell division protein [Parallela transversalis]
MNLNSKLKTFKDQKLLYWKKRARKPFPLLLEKNHNPNYEETDVSFSPYESTGRLASLLLKEKNAIFQSSMTTRENFSLKKKKGKAKLPFLKDPSEREKNLSYYSLQRLSKDRTLGQEFLLLKPIWKFLNGNLFLPKIPYQIHSSPLAGNKAYWLAPFVGFIFGHMLISSPIKRENFFNFQWLLPELCSRSFQNKKFSNSKNLFLPSFTGPKSNSMELGPTPFIRQKEKERAFYQENSLPLTTDNLVNKANNGRILILRASHLKGEENSTHLNFTEFIKASSSRKLNESILAQNLANRSLVNTKWYTLQPSFLEKEESFKLTRHPNNFQKTLHWSFCLNSVQGFSDYSLDLDELPKKIGQSYDLFSLKQRNNKKKLMSSSNSTLFATNNSQNSFPKKKNSSNSTNEKNFSKVNELAKNEFDYFKLLNNCEISFFAERAKKEEDLFKKLFFQPEDPIQSYEKARWFSENLIKKILFETGFNLSFSKNLPNYLYEEKQMKDFDKILKDKDSSLSKTLFLQRSKKWLRFSLKRNVDEIRNLKRKNILKLNSSNSNEILPIPENLESSKKMSKESPLKKTNFSSIKEKFNELIIYKTLKNLELAPVKEEGHNLAKNFSSNVSKERKPSSNLLGETSLLTEDIFQESINKFHSPFLMSGYQYPDINLDSYALKREIQNRSFNAGNATSMINLLLPELCLRNKSKTGLTESIPQNFSNKKISFNSLKLLNQKLKRKITQSPSFSVLKPLPFRSLVQKPLLLPCETELCSGFWKKKKLKVQKLAYFPISIFELEKQRWKNLAFPIKNKNYRFSLSRKMKNRNFSTNFLKQKLPFSPFSKAKFPLHKFTKTRKFAWLVYSPKQAKNTNFEIEKFSSNSYGLSLSTKEMKSSKTELHQSWTTSTIFINPFKNSFLYSSLSHPNSLINEKSKEKKFRSFLPSLKKISFEEKIFGDSLTRNSKLNFLIRKLLSFEKNLKNTLGKLSQRLREICSNYLYWIINKIAKIRKRKRIEFFNLNLPEFNLEQSSGKSQKKVHESLAPFSLGQPLPKLCFCLNSVQGLRVKKTNPFIICPELKLQKTYLMKIFEKRKKEKLLRSYLSCKYSIGKENSVGEESSSIDNQTNLSELKLSSKNKKVLRKNILYFNQNQENLLKRNLLNRLRIRLGTFPVNEKIEINKASAEISGNFAKSVSSKKEKFRLKNKESRNFSQLTPHSLLKKVGFIFLNKPKELKLAENFENLFTPKSLLNLEKKEKFTLAKAKIAESLNLPFEKEDGNLASQAIQSKKTLFLHIKNEKNEEKKRRRKKQRRQTRRKTKRKRLYPRPSWLRFPIYQKFLKTRHPKTFFGFCPNYVQGISTRFEELNLRNKIYRTKKENWLAKQECFLDYPQQEKIVLRKRFYFQKYPLQERKSFYQIPYSMINNLKNLSLKSYWLRSHLDPYLKRVQESLNFVSHSSQKSTLLWALPSFLRESIFPIGKIESDRIEFYRGLPAKEFQRKAVSESLYENASKILKVADFQSNKLDGKTSSKESKIPNSKFKLGPTEKKERKKSQVLKERLNYYLNTQNLDLNFGIKGNRAKKIQTVPALRLQDEVLKSSKRNELGFEASTLPPKFLSPTTKASFFDQALKNFEYEKILEKRVSNEIQNMKENLTIGGQMKTRFFKNEPSKKNWSEFGNLGKTNLSFKNFWSLLKWKYLENHLKNSVFNEKEKIKTVQINWALNKTKILGSKERYSFFSEASLKNLLSAYKLREQKKSNPTKKMIWNQISRILNRGQIQIHQDSKKVSSSFQSQIFFLLNEKYQKKLERFEKRAKSLGMYTSFQQNALNRLPLKKALDISIADSAKTSLYRDFLPYLGKGKKEKLNLELSNLSTSTQKKYKLKTWLTKKSRNKERDKLLFLEKKILEIKKSKDLRIDPRSSFHFWWAKQGLNSSSYSPLTKANSSFARQNLSSLWTHNFLDFNFGQEEKPVSLTKLFLPSSSLRILVFSLSCILIHVSCFLALLHIPEIRSFMKFHLLILYKFSNSYLTFIHLLENSLRDLARKQKSFSKQKFRFLNFNRRKTSKFSKLIQDYKVKTNLINQTAIDFEANSQEKTKRVNLTNNLFISFDFMERNVSELAILSNKANTSNFFQNPYLSKLSFDKIKMESFNLLLPKQGLKEKIQFTRKMEERIKLSKWNFKIKTANWIFSSPYEKYFSSQAFQVTLGEILDEESLQGRIKSLLLEPESQVQTDKSKVKLSLSLLESYLRLFIYKLIKTPKIWTIAYRNKLESQSKLQSGRVDNSILFYLKKIEENWQKWIEITGPKTSGKTSQLFFKFLDFLEKGMIGTGQIWGQSIFQFLEQPRKLILNWIADVFLLEWSSDILFYLPDSFDIAIWTSFQKWSRGVKGALIPSTYAFPFILSPVLFFLYQKSLLNLMGSLLENLIKPDKDILIRQKQGIVFWDIWAEILILLADEYNINISSLNTLKDEENLLLEKFLQKDQNPGSQPKDSAELAFKDSKSKQYENQFLAKQKQVSSKIYNYDRSEKFKELQSLMEKIQNDRARPPFPEKNLTNLEKKAMLTKFYMDFFKKVKTENINPVLASKLRFFNKEFKLGLFEQIKLPFMKEVEELNFKKLLEISPFQVILDNSFGFTEEVKMGGVKTSRKKWKKWSITQSFSYEGRERDFFLDIHPAKSLSHFHIFKPSLSQAELQPLAQIICQINSGLLLKEISKNLLVVGAPGAGKSLLIQAIAGETEIQMISDHAKRYAMVSRGMAVGMKLLREVFDALALYSPCLFLIEDIHLIGERRPLLISDDENAKAAESGGNASLAFEREEVHEKNQVIYQLNKHAISHYKKPYKGDFSLLIPTNHFSFDLFLGRKKEKKAKSGPLTSLYFEKEIEKNEARFNSSPFGLESESTNLSSSSLPLSQLQLKSKEFFAPPATSPLTLFILKEQRKFKPRQVLPELSWEGKASGSFSGQENETLSGSTNKAKSNYSIRAKLSLLADMAVSNLSAKLDRITDLLVIIDSVRSQRGFIVFATTHIPFVLDPALRRPGRLDQKISIPSLPNLSNKFEILRSKFEGQNSNLTELNLFKSLVLQNKHKLSFTTPNSNLRKTHYKSKDKSYRTYSAKESMEPIHSNPSFDLLKYSSLLQNLNEREIDQLVQRQKLILFTLPDTKLTSRLALTQFKKTEIYKNASSIPLIKDKIVKSGVNLTLAKEKAKSSLTNYEKQNLKSWFFNKYIESWQPKRFSISNENFYWKKEWLELTKRKKTKLSKIKDFRTKLPLQELLSFSAQNQQKPSNLKSVAYFKLGQFLINSVIFNKNCQFSNDKRLESLSSKAFTSQVKTLALKDPKIKAPFRISGSMHLIPGDIGKITAQSSFFLNKEPLEKSSAGVFQKLYSPNFDFKNQIMLLIAGKIGEFFAYNSDRISGALTLSTRIDGRINNKQSKNLETKFKNLPYQGLWSLEGIDLLWQSIHSLVLSIFYKRYLYQKNSMVFQLLDIQNYQSLKNGSSTNWNSSAEGAFIFNPAKGFENFKRTEKDFHRKALLKIHEKIQLHEQQKRIKKLYQKSTNKDINAYSLKERELQSLNYLEESRSAGLIHSSSIQAYYRNRILFRHRFYLSNLWWNGHLAEHNTERTFSSDVDWRYLFLKDVGDVLIDFPDADQHYNPRNRRWMLSSGYWADWFKIEKITHQDIYSHFIFESFFKAYQILDQNRELLDSLSYQFLRKGRLPEI